MKKLVAALCLAGSVVAFAACTTDGSGYVDSAPYASERTAGMGSGASAEHVYTGTQTK